MQRWLREFITVTFDDRSMNHWSSTVTVLNSPYVMTDHICSDCTFYSWMDHERVTENISSSCESKYSWFIVCFGLFIICVALRLCNPSNFKEVSVTPLFDTAR